jgi:O-antigen ligase
MKFNNLTVIKIKKLEIPFIIWIVFGCTFIADAIEFPILGRNISGWAWVVPLIISIFIIIRSLSRITFPILVWMPWICMVVFYFANSGFSYLQRNILLLCPIIVGMAVSTCQTREIQLEGFLALIRISVFVLFSLVIIRTGLLITGVLPPVTALAPQSITACLLCSILAVEYSINRKSSLVQWILGAAIPVIALTRTAMTVAGMTIPFTFASLKIRKRLIFLTIVAVLGVTVFYTERVQRKMFYSGQGTIKDMRIGNPDLFTAGRSRLWDHLKEEIKIKPVWGHGSNASEGFVLSMTWGTLTHPHNDWLRLLYDYGFVGTSVFAFCMIIQILDLLKKAKQAPPETRILIFAGASSFLPFVLLMFTDNIILYAAFFGNLQFTMLGLAYAAQKTLQVDSQHYYRMLGMRSPVNTLGKGTGKDRGGSNHFLGGR